MKKEIQYIYDIPKFTKKASLDNTREFIDRLGAECTDSHIIHVAGTNGKGSVCTYLDNILRCAGYKTGLFTSPHLVDINERIAVDGTMISDGDFERIFKEAKDVSVCMKDDGFVHPSFFEFLFGMAMKYFSEQKPDFIILETGLGGRLDATNIIAKPAVCVITSIGLDHVEYLGDTYEAIASEKAGIIKSEAPVVWMDKRADVTKVISDVAEHNRAISYMIQPDCIRINSADDKKIDFSLNNMYYCNEHFTIRTSAAYQPENAALALTAAYVLGIRDMDCLRKGLWDTFWMGRMQQVMNNFVIDGAHNDDGIRSFLFSVRENSKDCKRVIFFSAVKDKHYEGMIEQICNSRLFDECMVAPLDDPRGLGTDVMTDCFEKWGMPVTVYDSVEEGCAEATDRAGNGSMVYAAGSLYFAGEIIRYLRRNKL